MKNLFTSDTHLLHKAIPKYRTEFSSMEEHDSYIIDKIVSLPKRTVLHILGDFIFDGDRYEEYIERLSKKKCRIKLILGNHCSKNLYRQKEQELFELQLPLYSYKNNWISHCPIHPKELRGRDLNIHGHLHKSIIEDDRYFNVNLDINNYEFVTWEEIRDRQNKVKINKEDLNEEV